MQKCSAFRGFVLKSLIRGSVPEPRAPEPRCGLHPQTTVIAHRQLDRPLPVSARGLSYDETMQMALSV